MNGRFGVLALGFTHRRHRSAEMIEFRKSIFVGQPTVFGFCYSRTDPLMGIRTLGGLSIYGIRT